MLGLGDTMTGYGAEGVHSDEGDAPDAACVSGPRSQLEIVMEISAQKLMQVQPEWTVKREQTSMHRSHSLRSYGARPATVC